jgi:formylmethanofuran dehydrogenase subunit C
MHGGFIHVCGNASHLAGAAYRGSRRGMTGGKIFVRGRAGNEVGLAMRRGLIAIGGACGDMLGFNMIAGTVLVFGACGLRPGAGMRRGTIGLLGSRPPALLPGFRYASTFRPQVMRLLLREVERSGMAVDAELPGAEFDCYQGDFVTLGKGEILLRHPPASGAA